MPLWQDAPRGEGAATGLGAAAMGLAGAANGCCANAADEIVKIPAAKIPASVANRIRSSDQGAGIEVTGWRANMTVPE
jgi:hypothetical protein